MALKKNQLTYKDFQIGQKVTCVKVDDFFDQHLTVGKKYKIEDLDFHFPDAICIRSDNKKISMFVNIEYFEDLKAIRKEKIKRIEKSK